jgi:hypothetical protein
VPLPGTSRVSKCGVPEARARLQIAQAYLEVAELVVTEDQGEYLSVSAGLSVLAGIAASDSICCIRLRRRHRGDDHRAAAELIEQATPDGKQLAAVLRRLLDVKGRAHYGVTVVSTRSARDATKWAGRLVERAAEELAR